VSRTAPRRRHRVGRLECMTPHFVRSKNSKAVENGTSERALSRAVRRLRPSTWPCTCCRWRWHVQLHCLPQQAQRKVPLGGRAARDRRRLLAADEHADRPRPSSVMLREHMLTAVVDPHVESKKWCMNCGRARLPVLISARGCGRTMYTREWCAWDPLASASAAGYSAWY